MAGESSGNRVYLSGPMTGIADFNFPAFHAAAERWRQIGYDVVSPAESYDGRTDLPRPTYLRKDIQALLSVDGIVMLAGWEKSKGATLEHSIAEELGLTIYFDSPRPSVMEEAHRLVKGDRGKDYGHPLDDFTRTGKLWGTILGSEAVSAEKVALCMAALKISRECNGHKRDNLVDVCGYIGTLEMVHDEIAKRGGR